MYLEYVFLSQVFYNLSDLGMFTYGDFLNLEKLLNLENIGLFYGLVKLSWTL